MSKELLGDVHCTYCNEILMEDGGCLYCDDYIGLDLNDSFGPDAPIVAEEWTTVELQKLVDYDFSWSKSDVVKESVRRAKVELERRGL